MRKISLGSGILAATLMIFAVTTVPQLLAQEKPAAPPRSTAQPKPAAVPAKEAAPGPALDPAKEAKIRELMDVTGTKNLGEQLLRASMEQLRASVAGAQPQNARAQQMVELFLERFRKRFDPNALTEVMIPIYDKHLSDEDLKGLLEFYRSPLGQRTLKALAAVVREAQAAGFALGQQAAEAAMRDVQTEHPELLPGAKETPPQPQPQPKP